MLKNMVSIIYEKRNHGVVKCDIAIPSATQNEIDDEDAKSL